MAKTKPAEKSAKSPIERPKVGKLVPQPNGRGAIWQGAPANPVAGPGRPKDVVREKLAGLAEGKGFKFLDELMEGKVRFRLIGKCEKCGHEDTKPLGKGEMDAVWEEIKATVDHRLKANDQILRYGVGTKDETITTVSPEVTARLQETVNLVAQKAPELMGELEAIWKK